MKRIPEYARKIKLYLKTTHFKTTLWYSLIFFTLEITIGVIIYFYLSSSMYRQLDNSLKKQASLIYNFVSDNNKDLINFQPDSIYSTPDELVYDLIFEAILYNRNNTFVQIHFKDKLVFKSDNLKDITLPFVQIDKDSMFMKNLPGKVLSENPARAVYLKKESYYIVIAFPIQLINETLQSLLDIYLIMAPAFLILSVIGGSLISRKSFSRMDFITRKTNEITTKNLNERIDGEELTDEYGRLIRTLNDMIGRIKISIDYLNQFSVAASHELKTPLTILRGELELALRSPRPAAEYKEILESNYEETLRLINIIERLFFIARLDNSNPQLNISEINAYSFLRRAIEQVKPLSTGKNISFALICSESLQIRVDPELFRQAIINLLENAVKYGYEDEKISIECRQPDSKISITVSNKGDIIPGNSIPYIFDRFYRIESSRNRGTGGIGLGLSIVKSVINWHRGEINVISEKNETIFTIIIPA
jgi:heavy metal sensor kinase